MAIGEVKASRGWGGGRGGWVVRWRIILAAPSGAHLQAVLALEMALQVVLLGESLVAQVALVGPVPSVQVHVVLEVVAVQEAGWAVRARIGAFSCVLPHVDLQLVIPGASRGNGWHRSGLVPLSFLPALSPSLPQDTLSDWLLA